MNELAAMHLSEEYRDSNHDGSIPLDAPYTEFCRASFRDPGEDESGEDVNQGEDRSPKLKPRIVRGGVISDLHLLASRSTAEGILPEVYRAMEQADFFVLNGDIFDFKWSTLDSTEASVGAAIGWLNEVTAKYPHCQFHYIEGNHDAQPLFLEALTKLVQKTPNLSFHPYYLELGDNIFIHGDVCSRPKIDRERLDELREKYSEERRGKGMSFLYDLFTATRLHRVPELFQDKNMLKRVMAKRLVDFLGSMDPELLARPRTVYFGHTHFPFVGYQYRGHTFHNTGAAIRGLESRMYSVQVEISDGGA